jgi:hypothetical protein
MNALRQLINTSLRARIVAVFLGLLLVVQLAGFTAIRASLSSHAQSELPQRLGVGDRVLQSLLAQRAQKLTDGARLLSADYGFREAIHSNDRDTIVSVLENHGQRIGATQVALYSADLELRASTGEPLDSVDALARRLWVTASAAGTPVDSPPSEIALLAGQPYQFVMAPVRKPSGRGCCPTTATNWVSKSISTIPPWTLPASAWNSTSVPVITPKTLPVPAPSASPKMWR